MARDGKPGLWFAAALLLLSSPAAAEPLDSIRDVIGRLQQCWKPPPRSRARPMDITVIVSFNRDGAILGRPRVSHETQSASDDERLAYRIAAMEALQRCMPLPFTEGLGGAIAGRPLAVRFSTRKSYPTQAERLTWLTPKTP